MYVILEHRTLSSPVCDMYETGIRDAIVVEPYKEGRTVSMSFYM